MCPFAANRLLEHEDSPLLVYRGERHRNQDGLEPEKSHLHSDVLWLLAIVHEELLDASEPLSQGISDLVPCVLLTRFEPVAGLSTVYRRAGCVGQCVLLSGPIRNFLDARYGHAATDEDMYG